MNKLLLDAALAFAGNGCSVVPTRPDGTKAPSGSWQSYQTEPPTVDQLRTWLGNGAYDGIGLVCGTVSGNLEMLEFEGRAVDAGIPNRVTELADNSGLGDLWTTVKSGYLEATPSGGYHLLYRVDGPIAGNTKLARRPATADELATAPNDKIKVLIETRGEGGYVIVAPSNGRTHPTGRPWAIVTGSIESIPTITTDQRDAIHTLCRTFDQMPTTPTATPPGDTSGEGGRPGDDYNDRTTWDDVLVPLGWVKVYAGGDGTIYWRRPGKSVGISATTGRGDGDNLYVFSTSTEFDAEIPYSKFAAYTLIHHRGDYAAAAKDLRGRGYGDDRSHRTTTIDDEDPAEWRPPRPLGQTYPPPLPVTAAGPILGPMVRDVAETLQVPTDLVLNMALSVVATAAQGRWRVRLNPEWTEILSISSTSVAASGERKSAILSILSTPLVELEKELRESAGPSVRWRDEQIKLAEARVATARKAAQKDSYREQELRAELDTLGDLPALHLPRLLADDATPEALTRVLDQQNGTVGVLSAEPGFFATMAGRYAGGVSNLDGVLKATSGEPIRVDRAKAEPILIDHPCLTVAVCIQPGLLEQLGRKPELRYAGFLARFLYVCPSPMVGQRGILSILSTSPINREGVSSSSLSLYDSRIRTLSLNAYTRRTLTQLTELELTPDGHHALDKFRTELEPRLHPHIGDLATIADWGSKLPGVAIRIAAAVTVLKNPEATTIEEWTMADAIQLAEAYIPHAVHVLDSIRGHGDGLSEARDILATIRRHHWTTFSLRDLNRQLANTEWVKTRGRDAIDEQLDVLVDYGHIRPIPEPPRKGPGRLPSPRYAVNPAHIQDPS